MTGETIEVAEIRDLLRILPHRYPFIMVDRIVDIRGDEYGVGIKNVSVNEPQFQGHFPDNPVMPGVLIIEGMAQTACVLTIRKLEPTQKRRLALFLTIDKARFRKPATPGDTIEYHVYRLKRRGNMFWYRTEAKIRGVLSAEAVLGAFMTEE